MSTLIPGYVETNTYQGFAFRFRADRVVSLQDVHHPKRVVCALRLLTGGEVLVGETSAELSEKIAAALAAERPSPPPG